MTGQAIAAAHARRGRIGCLAIIFTHDDSKPRFRDPMIRGDNQRP
jgi:hypothetical protein